ncbi:MAG TPA: universal stress protein [Acidimicrobiia bacterium]|nr:universal stress protein [Acidimicrobiia bacterium]
MTAKIVLAVDGSEHCARATHWCAEHATALGARVVVVHAVDMPNVMASSSAIPFVPPPLSPAQLTDIHDVVARDWCKPLVDAGIEHQVVISEGRPSEVVMEAAEAAQADLIVCGRRGRGGFAELLLGSTSHELTHRAQVPLLIVP